MSKWGTRTLLVFGIVLASTNPHAQTPPPTLIGKTLYVRDRKTIAAFDLS